MTEIALVLCSSHAAWSGQACAMRSGAYTEANVKMAGMHEDFVMGFISMTPAKWDWGPGSPGCHLCLGPLHAFSSPCPPLSPASPPPHALAL